MSITRLGSTKKYSVGWDAAFGKTSRPARKKVMAKKPNKKNICVFCKTNGEQEGIYSSHILKDKTGRVVCPILRAYTCPNCGAHGDVAHTLKYCPLTMVQRTQLRTLP